MTLETARYLRHRSYFQLLKREEAAEVNVQERKCH